MKQNFQRLLALLFLLVTLTACRTAPAHQTDLPDTDAPDPAEITLTDEPITGMNRVMVTNSLQYDQGYLYFEDWKIFYRYNVRTGNLTTVCGDPLCTHNNMECLLYSTHADFVLYQGNIYISRLFFGDWVGMDDSLVSDFVRYDIGKHELQKYTPYEASSGGRVDEIYTEHYRFYYDVVKEKEEQNGYYALCRMDLNSGDIVVLGGEEDSELNQSTMLFAVNGRVYFQFAGDLFSTNLDLQDRQTVMKSDASVSGFQTDGEYIYWGERPFESSEPWDFYRARLDGSEITPLGIRSYYFTLTQNYIYFKSTDKVVIGKDHLSGSIGEEVTMTGTTLYRARHDGTGQEEMFCYRQGDTYYGLSHSYFIGDVIYSYYTAYCDADDDGIIRDDEAYKSYNHHENRLIRIDMITDEISFISCEDRSPKPN